MDEATFKRSYSATDVGRNSSPAGLGVYTKTEIRTPLIYLKGMTMKPLFADLKPKSARQNLVELLDKVRSAPSKKPHCNFPPVSDEMLDKLAGLINAAGQITGVDLAAEAGLTLESLRAHTKLLAQLGLAHRLRGKRYLGGLWIPGPESAGEHEPSAVQLRIRVKHWNSLPCKIDIAEALLFNRFPEITSSMLTGGQSTGKSIRLTCSRSH